MAEATVDPAELHAVSMAVKELDPAPRQDRWGHLSLCVIASTFSINANYKSVVAPVVRRYAEWADLDSVLLRGEELTGQISPRAGEQPLSAFLAGLESVTDEDSAASIYCNRGRTSTRSGILKSAASRRIAEILVAEGIDTLADVSALLADPARLKTVETRLSAVPGNGIDNVRTGYIWMTAGDDHNIKPDRHILKWLAGVLGHPVAPAESRALLGAAATDLGITAWSADHAIWKLMSARPRRARSSVAVSPGR